MNQSRVGVLIILSLIVVACSKEDVDPKEPLGAYENGILISNEGPFQNGTGTVSFISEDLEMVENAIYNAVNNEDLGNIVQSIGFTDSKAYVIANNSNKITVVNRYTFKKETIIETGLSNPRYFVSANGKGYVTNWGDTADDTDDFVAVINLTTNTVESSIAVELGPEEIVAQSNDIYVAHEGAFGQNNKVSVIDNTDAVTSVITVGDVPNALQFDATGNLWVLSGGKPSFTGEETAGSLSRINTATNEVVAQFDFQSTEHPNHLSYDGTNVYYSLAGAVYSMSTSALELPTEASFEGLNIYAMAIKDGKLYTTDAGDFASIGNLSIYDLNTKEELKAIAVGIIPGGIYFN